MDEQQVVKFAREYVQRETGHLVHEVDVAFVGPDRWRVRFKAIGAMLTYRVIVDTDAETPRARIIRG